MTPAAALPPPAKFGQSTQAVSDQFTAVLTARSKTVKIPSHIRVKMQAMKAVNAFWNGEAGKAMYQGLVDEQKTAAKPKAKTASGA